MVVLLDCRRSYSALDVLSNLPPEASPACCDQTLLLIVQIKSFLNDLVPQKRLDRVRHGRECLYYRCTFPRTLVLRPKGRAFGRTGATGRTKREVVAIGVSVGAAPCGASSQIPEGLSVVFVTIARIWHMVGCFRPCAAAERHELALPTFDVLHRSGYAFRFRPKTSSL